MNVVTKLKLIYKQICPHCGGDLYWSGYTILTHTEKREYVIQGTKQPYLKGSCHERVSWKLECWNCNTETDISSFDLDRFSRNMNVRSD